MQENLDALLDPYTLLGMTALQPLLETVNTLVEFAQGRNVFVSDFVGALEVCEERLHCLYLDSSSAFATDDFWAFTSLQTLTHKVIHLKWVEDLNDSSEQLAFMVNGDKLFAKTKLPGSQVVKPVDHETYNTLIKFVKAECEGELPHTLGCLLLLSCFMFCKIEIWISNSFVVCVFLLQWLLLSLSTS